MTTPRYLVLMIARRLRLLVLLLLLASDELGDELPHTFRGGGSGQARVEEAIRPLYLRAVAASPLMRYQLCCRHLSTPHTHTHTHTPTPTITKLMRAL